VPAFPNESIHLSRPRLAINPFGHLGHKLGRHLADRLDVGSPVVIAKQFGRHTRKHFFELLAGHLKMRPQRGQHIDQLLAKIVIRHARELPRTAMESRKVRRHRNHALARPERVEHLEERFAKLIVRKFGRRRPDGIMQHFQFSLLL